MFKPDKTYTEKQKAFLMAMADISNGGDIRKCMEIAGYSPSNSSASVTSPLKDELIMISKELIASHSIKATSKVLELLDKPATPGAKIILEASKQLLDRAKVEEDATLDIDVGSGIVILPAKGVVRSE